MNIREKEIIKKLYTTPYVTQRELAQLNACSLGTVNKCLKNLREENYIDLETNLTDKSRKLVATTKPKNAIILAAGYGMRMVPINTEIPKGLLKIYGEPLIERIIRQLHEVGINEIYVVVGFMKECYEYLIDEYGVKLLVNPDYALKNNLHSLKIACQYLGNSYVIPCDVWCAHNPFNEIEIYSWYMITEQKTFESNIKVNRKNELKFVSKEDAGNSMIGISYLNISDSKRVRDRVCWMTTLSEYDSSFWEQALYDSDKINVAARVVSSDEVIEINTYEQLRELDSGSSNLKSKVIEVAARALNANEKDIVQISVLKKGMTNRSFLFSCNGKKYIMRIPGEGTEKLINREQEALVYSVIKNKNICDQIVYLNPINGYKITEYLENTRTCDAFSESDIKKCMLKLREFHELELQVDHEFDMFRQIDFYESLWGGCSSIYKDYEITKANVLSLRNYIETCEKKKVLTHIDAIPDNFLFYNKKNETEQIVLLDWEYAAMQDPHVDVAMFCIYSMYNKEQIDGVIDVYFNNQCKKDVRIKIYCYISVCGLLWSNWCEYKRCLGVEFGEYSLKQYRYAKEYYRIVQKELLEMKNV